MQFLKHRHYKFDINNLIQEYLRGKFYLSNWNAIIINT